MSEHRGLSYAPWLPRQVDALNAYQASGVFHPFTCGGGIDGEDCRADLVATEKGWICPRNCGYTQEWAHNFMVAFDPEQDDWRKKLRPAEAPHE